MSQLIQKYKQDHQAIVAALEDIRKAGVDHPQFSQKMRSAKAALLAHLKHEDTELYPRLKEASLQNNELLSTLNVLLADIQVVAQVALDFFAKYENGGSPVEFSKDFSRLNVALATRIRREESTLYPMFDKIVDKTAA